MSYSLQCFKTKIVRLVNLPLQQTSTADMLELAVEYIKGLQRQVKVTSKSNLKFIKSHEDPANTFYSQETLFFLCRLSQIRKRNALAHARANNKKPERKQHLSFSLILICTESRQHLSFKL